jgi:hypothetical protein
MTNDERSTNNESVAKSVILSEVEGSRGTALRAFAMGFLDLARNDGHFFLRHSSFVIDRIPSPLSFELRH